MKHLLSKIFFTLFLLFGAISASAVSFIDQKADDTRFSRQQFAFGQNTLQYRQADICHDESSKPIIVLYLHGGSSRGSDNEAQLNELAVSAIYTYLSSNAIPATMIVPQCPSGGGWTGPLCKVLNELMKQYSTDGIHDPNRIYVMGGSMRGTGTWAQVGNFPNSYAAAMPVAGNPSGLDAANVATTPVRTVMGTEDKLMSISTVEQFQTEVLAVGGSLQLDIVAGWSHADTCEQSYTDERLDWLFSNVKGNPTDIKSVVNCHDDSSSVCYDICGRRIAQPTKGLFIQNRKKYIR